MSGNNEIYERYGNEEEAENCSREQNYFQDQIMKLSQNGLLIWQASTRLTTLILFLFEKSLKKQILKGS
ncbi:MAG: hypothetical protein DRI57_30640 [Deltaproteobacteria bacterium]|nr:MAG: hypothetical protein DRI57_30640 [Deltaproteobacteria bacterium]